MHHIRALRTLTLRNASGKGGFIGTLEGYAAVFESDSVEFGGFEKPWVERIARGAFSRTLREKPDVVALWSHDPSRPIARAPGTLTLREDQHGLRVEIRLVDTQLNRDTVASVRAGLVDSMSFGFEVPSKNSVRWHDEGGREVRTLLDVDLHEVSPVVWPAYPASKVGARSAAVRVSNGLDDELRAIQRERDEHFRQATGVRRARQATSSHARDVVELARELLRAKARQATGMRAPRARPDTPCQASDEFALARDLARVKANGIPFPHP